MKKTLPELASRRIVAAWILSAGILMVFPQAVVAQLGPELNQGNASALLGISPSGSKMGSKVSGAGDVNGDGYSDLIAAAADYQGKGAAIVFYGSSNGPGSANHYIITNEASSAKFGEGVSAAGDVNGDGFADVIVASYTSDSVYVYHGSASGIGHAPAARLSVPMNPELSFSKISGAGDINRDGYSDFVVVASDYDDPVTGKGAIFAFHGSATGMGTTPSAIVPVGALQLDADVCISGAGDVNGDGYSDIVTGAPRADGSLGETGKMIVFHGSSGGLVTTPATVLEGAGVGDRFGSAVSGAGDVNGDGYADLIMAGYPDSPGTARAYIYHGSAIGINLVPAITFDWPSSEGIPPGVSSAGDFNGDGYGDVIVGTASSDSGPAHLVMLPGSSSGIDTTGMIVTIDNSNIAYGQSVTSVGDMNGDGFSDIAIGAPLAEDGLVAVFNGMARHISAQPDQIAEVVVPGHMGQVSAPAGDVNGDGYGDVMCVDNRVNESTVYILHGSANGLITPPALAINSEEWASYFGSSVASAGDVNGDGYGDVIIGASGYDNYRGAAYVYYGSPGGIVPGTRTFLPANNRLSTFGTTVSSAGDLNGDGFSDVVIGAPDHSKDKVSEGAVFIYLGTASGISTTPILSYKTNLESARLGIVSGPGDINGDGFSDVVAGAYSYSNDQEIEGAIYVFYGNKTGVSSNPVIIEGNIPYGEMGSTVIAAGDLNGDSFNDVLVSGKIFYGSAAGLVASAGDGGLWTNTAGDINGDGYSDMIDGEGEIRYGSPSGVAATGYSGEFWQVQRSGGDINGDGFSDMLLDQPFYLNGSTSTGALFVFYGNRGGLGKRFQIFDASTTHPISQGNSVAEDFGIGFWAKSPEGRTKGKLVWETRSEGKPFSSASPISNSTQFTGQQVNFTDLGLTGAHLIQDIAKAGFNTRVRARVKYDMVTSLNGQVYGPWAYPLGTPGTQSTVALPVELKYFTAAPNSEGGVKLTWETTSETDNESFTIERSPDARNWKEWKTLPGGGNSANALYYQETDPKPYSGISYYRLRQNDFDGKSTWSAVRSVSFGAKEAEQYVYPNPASSVVTIRTRAADFSIIDVGGKDVGENIRLLDRRDGFMSIDVSRLVPGMYFVKSGNKVNKLYVQ